jgi:hypothetical protein
MTVPLRSRVSLGVALLLGATLAACGNTTAPPQNLPAPTPSSGASNTTTATLSSTAPTTFSTITASGISDSATLPAASTNATVTETIATSPFGSDAALSAKRAAPAAQRQIADAALSATAYVQFSANQTVTVTGTTTITFTLPSITAGDAYYLAVYQNGAWIAPAAGPGTVSGNTVTFSGNNGTSTISPAAPLELALYATAAAPPTPTPTATPTPTPTPVPTPVASPNSLLFDAGNPTTQTFTVSEAGDLANYTGAINCSTAPSGANFVAELTSATATPVQTGSGAATFTVQGGNEVGTCTVTVTDANSATATVAVTVDSSTITVSGHARGH